MMIQKLSCTQFAGIRDRDLSFTEGLNVIYGKNESGKSSLVNLLSRTLFQNAKIDGRTNKDFKELYFPGAKKDGGIPGDFADGKITLQTEKGTYTLFKEWGTEPRCTLSTPDGVIRSQSKIEEILKEILLYGEGVYGDLLLSSQRNTDTSLQTLLDASKKTDGKQEIVNVVSQAFAESDGISVDEIEQAIAARIADIEGKNWDRERSAPVRKAGGGRHQKQKGKVMEAYYKLEDAEIARKTLWDLEKNADDKARAYATKDEAAAQAEKEYENFQKFASHLILQRERQKNLALKEKEIRKIQGILSQWPACSEALDEAESLLKEREHRKIRDLWAFVLEMRGELSEKDLVTADLPYPENGEITELKTLQRQITTLENKLCGMNLTAAIQMLNGNTVEVVSLRTGQRVELTEGLASITEAVKIRIPGVMEMELSPANVDVKHIGKEISEKKIKMATILEKYKVETLEALEDYRQQINTAKEKIEDVNRRIERKLGNLSVEQLEEQNGAIEGSPCPSKEAIEEAIYELCGMVELNKFITQKETELRGYEKEYGTLSAIADREHRLTEELEKEKAFVMDTEEIPSAYGEIADPEGHLKGLKQNWDFKRGLRDDAYKAKSDAENQLDNYKRELSHDPTEGYEKAERYFEEQNALLHHWIHIQQVFREQKEKINHNPMEDMARSFTQYLGLISNNKVSSRFPEGDKLNMEIFSGNNLLDYGKLSEGTKETVSLAFRLAVLDHLFPYGGGVIVLDDPFADMDEERTEQACTLIRECAKRHQVIFLTCNKRLAQSLQGNSICIS